MTTSNVEIIEVGIPGPPGAGVSAAEKASFVTLTGAHVFTNAQEFRYSNNAAAIFSSGLATTDRTLLVDTLNKEVELRNGADFRMFSDASTTEVASIDGATGNAQFDGTVTTTRIVGDTVYWGFPIDGGGSAITTGVKIYGYPVPYNCLVTAWEIIADQSGSIVVDIWQDTYANYAPTAGDSITTSEKPTLSTASKNTDTSLNSGNGWALTGGRWLRFNVDSATTVTWVCIKLTVVRT